MSGVVRWTQAEELGITADALRQWSAEKAEAGLHAEARELARMADAQAAAADTAARQPVAQQQASAREVSLEVER
jgi:hypothetical protein